MSHADQAEAPPRPGRGGARPGAGRKPGVVPRRRYALDLIEGVMRDETLQIETRLQAALFLVRTQAGEPRNRPASTGINPAASR